MDEEGRVPAGRGGEQRVTPSEHQERQRERTEPQRETDGPELRKRLERDAVGYQSLVYHLTDAEMGEMLAEIRDILRARLENQPTEQRTPRLFTTITMPATRPKGTDL